VAITLQSKSKRQSRKEQADGELIEKSLKRYKITAESESEIRTKGLFDLNFSVGEGQWDGSIKAGRETEGRPCLTVNRIPTFLRQYTGEERQHRPAMLVDPVGSGSDPEVAEICQGVLRHIEVASFADTVYDYHYDFMLRAGWTDWRVSTEYLSERSFDQEPRIRSIENSFAVWMSPIRQVDGSDPLWCHVTQDMGLDEYKETHPNSSLARLNFTSNLGNAEPSWVTKDGIRIAEYWWLELQKRQLLQLDDGSTIFRDEFKGDKGLIVDERDTVSRTVKCVKHNASEVLNTYEYRGRYIPIIELNGTKLNINGKVYKAGIVRDAIDPQRVYNIEVTGMAEMIALAPKDPLYVAEGSLGNHEEEYRQANRKNFPYLYFKAYDEQGRPLPPPTRASREPPIEAMAKLVQQSDYDLKSVIGIYGPGLGEQGPAQESGFAILKRQQQSDTGTVNWSDNLNHAIRWQGKILLDLFPKLITSARVQRIVNPDDSVKHAVIFNSQHSDQSEAEGLLNGDSLKKIYDVGLGEYDVTLSSGPTYRTARQEAFQALTAIVTAKPELFPIVGDIWVKYADWPGAHVLGERLKKMLPPNLQDDGDDDQDAKMAMLESQLQQLGAQHQQLVAELSRASDTIRTNRLQIESKERIAMFQASAGMIEAMIKANVDAGRDAMNAELATIQHRMELLHESMTVDEEAGEAPATPELPSQVEPKAVPVTPAMPPHPVPGSTGMGPSI
jgi:hypothetical protein